MIAFNATGQIVRRSEAPRTASAWIADGIGSELRRVGTVPPREQSTIREWIMQRRERQVGSLIPGILQPRVVALSGRYARPASLIL